jgi:hypothetical protein
LSKLDDTNMIAPFWRERNRTVGRHLAIALGAIALAWLAGPVVAADGPAPQEPLSPQPTPTVIAGGNHSYSGGDNGCLCVTVGERTWINWGQSNWNISGTSPAGTFVTPLSELKWNNINSIVAEFNVNAVLNNRWVSRVDIGTGGIRTGNMRDFDFLGNDRTGLFSDSISNVRNDGLFYVNADFGIRFVGGGVRAEETRLTIDGLVGYQYWHEKYLASDFTQLVGLAGLAPDPGSFFPGTGIMETWNRSSIRVGASGSYRISERGAFTTRLMFVPWSAQEMIDNHVFRSIQSAARPNGGFGVMWDATLSYRIWNGLSAEIGYQIWEQFSGHTAYTEVQPDGTVTVPFNSMETFRHGVLMGVNWRF